MGQSSGDFSYVPPEPPIAWELTVEPSTPTLGQLVSIGVSLTFNDTITVGQWEASWSTTVSIYRPDGSISHLHSERRPIVVGSNEVYSVSEIFRFPGVYSVAASIQAGAEPAELGTESEEEPIYLYHSQVRQIQVTIPGAVPPDTGWHQLTKSPALVKPITNPRPPIGGAVVGQNNGNKDNTESDKGKGSDLTYRFKVPAQSSSKPGLRHLIGKVDSPLRGGRKLKIELTAAVDSARIASGDLGNLQVLNQTHYQIGPLSSKAKGSLWFFKENDTLIIEISDARQVFNVNGVFTFEGESGGLQAAALMYAAIFCQDGFGDWYVEDDGYTDPSGFVSLQCGQTNFAFWVFAEPSNAIVYTTEDHNFDDNDYLYPHGHGLSISNPLHQTVDIDAQWSEIHRRALAGAFGIARTMLIGEQELINKVNPWPLPSLTPVLWDSACSQNITPNFGGFTVGGSKAIFLRGDNDPNSNRDQWDPCVILHEYSHKVMGSYAAIDPLAGGSHEYIRPAYTGSSLWRAKLLSYSEGWANFFQGFLRSSDDFYDKNNQGAKLFNILIERPKPDIPYVLVYNQTGPSNPTPWYDGADVEGAITEALWDVYDAVNDGDYFFGGQLWGHNNDYNSGDSWQGIDAIWDVFWDFDPRPADPNISFCRTIYDFVEGWRLKGYPIQGHFKDIMNAHNVAVFLPGDANNSGGVTISDSVKIVNYVFGGGSAPVPVLASGDANGDCIVNISDAQYVLNYAFSGGPAPVAGCS
jgi:hypothetical protein